MVNDKIANLSLIHTFESQGFYASRPYSVHSSKSHIASIASELSHNYSLKKRLNKINAMCNILSLFEQFPRHAILDKELWDYRRTCEIMGYDGELEIINDFLRERNVKQTLKRFVDLSDAVIMVW